jgi:hypothetical protein
MTRLTRGHRWWRRTAPLQHGGPTVPQIPQHAALAGGRGRLCALIAGEGAGPASTQRPTAGGLPRGGPAASPSGAADTTR